MKNEKQQVLLIAAKANMIWQFNKRNILILQSKGFDVHVAANFIDFGSFSDQENQKALDWLENNNVTVHQIDFERRLGTVRGNIKALRQLNNVFKREIFSFVHVHSPLGSILGRLVAKMNHVPVVYTCHGLHFYKGGSIKNWLIFYPIEYMFALMTHSVIVINGEDEKIVRTMPFKHRFRVHSNGANVSESLSIPNTEKKENSENIREELHISREDYLILSVGELSIRKNHALILDALSILQNRKLYPRLVIAGVGELQNELRMKITRLKLNEQVTLLGYRNDIRALNHAADLFVFPSIREGLGLSGLDAVVDGTYILGSIYGGIKDYITDDSVGKLISPFDSEKLADLIEECMGHEKTKFSKQAVTELLKFDVSEVDRVMADVYDNF
ncbi:glycosyltransferase [Weissella cibaria]|uniref:glycosyltransferase n=1 Tax=Weissella cibaria TaxID=137591 RepID=UPI00189EA3AA|nr:glycosyltransferase [Weissella cibaria]